MNIIIAVIVVIVIIEQILSGGKMEWCTRSYVSKKSYMPLDFLRPTLLG